MDFPRDFKRGLKWLWAEKALCKKPSLKAWELALIKSSFRKHDSLTEVLAHLILRSTGRPVPPLTSRVDLLPVAELCQLALLLAVAGQQEMAFSIAQRLPMQFPWLWCKEEEFYEEETLASMSLLQRALGKGGNAHVWNDSYFQALAQHLPAISLSSIIHFPQDVLDWMCVQNEEITCALTFSGKQTSLGAIISDKIEVRSFGPQVFPLSHSGGFGIRPIACHKKRWASLAACPETWFEIKVWERKKRIEFEVSFFGLKATHPFAFSFYVKAESAQIESTMLKPCTLHRYQGTAKPVLFGNRLSVESTTPGKMEVIPLAGKDGYWNCEYLAAFEIHPLNAKTIFSVGLS